MAGGGWRVYGVCVRIEDSENGVCVVVGSVVVFVGFVFMMVPPPTAK